MKKYATILGIDVDKLKLTVCLMHSAEDFTTRSFDNNPAGFQAILSWLSPQAPAKAALFCMEHTGVYTYPFIHFLDQQQLAYTLIPGLHIDKSMGLKRGKTDPGDAHQIAAYVQRFADRISPTRLPEKALLKIQLLQSFRQRLVKIKGQLSQPINELKLFTSDEIHRLVCQPSEQILRTIKAQIRQVEQQIHQIIQSSLLLKKQFQLITSVIGVGKHTAYYLLVATQGFTRMHNSRALSCWAGTAPFPYRSGKSIKKPDRISQWGDQQIKALLSCCVQSALRHDREIRAYFERKMKEGKTKACIYNAIRNKLLARICAVIKRGTPFEKRAFY